MCFGASTPLPAPFPKFRTLEKVILPIVVGLFAIARLPFAHFAAVPGAP